MTYSAPPRTYLISTSWHRAACNLAPLIACTAAGADPSHPIANLSPERRVVLRVIARECLDMRLGLVVPLPVNDDGMPTLHDRTLRLVKPQQRKHQTAAERGQRARLKNKRRR
jgi:hypothetical protein